MKTLSVVKFLVPMVLSLGLMAARAQETPGRAQVPAVLGNASYSASDGKLYALKPGQVLAPGMLITTGPKAAVDLFLGNSVGTLRLLENSTLVLKDFKLADVNGQTVVDLQLELRDGTVMGVGTKLSTASSKFDIKIPSGILRVTSGKFRVNSAGYIVLSEGSLNYVHISAQGDLTPYQLLAPPASYFSPVEGVRPAPKVLTDEIEKQFKSKLPTK